MTTTSDKTGAARRRLLGLPAGLMGLAGLGLLAFGPGATAQDDVDPIDEIRTMHQEYVELRSQISKEKAQAAETEQFLRDRIALVEQQIQIAREAAEESKGETAKTADSIAKLEQENESLKAATASLEEIIWGLERDALAIRAWMPEKLKEQTSTLAIQIPATEEAAESLKLYGRFIQLVALLNQIDKFNTSIQLVPEERKDGTDGVAVTAMYIGISAAYCANGAGTKAWVGTPSAEGYQWTPVSTEEEAAVILKAITIAEGKGTPEFVELPFTAAE